tara:strand:+ start:171 stop:590 length:420 start_codon:yes stop_codon:yes gene_type:complete
MSDELIKKLIESLTPDQKADLVNGLLNSNVKSDKTEAREETVSSQPKSNINEDFTVQRNEGLGRRSAPVSAKKNKWVDIGEDRDPDFDPEKFERMGRTARNRGKVKKKYVDCHVCGRGFHINENLIYGEFTRCNRCTGK